MSCAEFAEVAVGEYAVGEVGAIVFGKEYVDGWFEPAVLVDVVEDDDVGRVVEILEVGDGEESVFGNDGGYRGEFAGHHGWLVADGIGIGVVLVGDNEALGVAAVTAAEHGDMHFVAEEREDVLYHRGLAGAACGEVAYADGGDVGCLLFTDAGIPQEVADGDPDSVPNGEGEEEIEDAFAMGGHVEGKKG